MKNKHFKHHKKASPEHEIPRPEKKPENNPPSQPSYPEWLTAGSPEYIYMDEIIVYYSLN